MQHEPKFVHYFHDLDFSQPPHDQYNLDTSIIEEEDSNKLDKQEEEDHEELVLKSSKNKKDEMSSTTTSTMSRKNNKCAAGAGAGASKNDIHNKINTAHAPRDRRMRLTKNSLQILQFARLARV
ncbi:cytochrome-type monooxygenase [Capsicum annuum]|uniref:TCP domain-containing protein n=1 Tax=Capsicum annuum TaxID=4072 RepID=A0A2G2ZX09_CAPAN|nr:cytochrome-type monooxygenase [Capsicum annuum]PHT86495.1 hypothetical protein T459_08601 [Capsicum annuum]